MKSAKNSPVAPAIIETADMVVGGVYASPGEIFVYLGSVDTLEDVVPSFASMPPKTVAAEEHLVRLKGSDSPSFVERVQVEGEHLCLVLKPETRLDTILSDFQYALYRATEHHWRFRRSVTAVSHLATLPLSFDWMDKWKHEAVRHMYSTLGVNTRGGRDKGAWAQTRIAEHSAVLHVRPHGEQLDQFDPFASEYASLMLQYRNY